MRSYFLFAVLLACVLSAFAAEYQWGDCGPKDYLIAKDKVTKGGTWFGLPNSKKYVFKQKKIDSLTITCIIVTDRKNKCDASAVLESGGVGSKGCSIKFKGKNGSGCIKALVKIYGK